MIDTAQHTSFVFSTMGTVVSVTTECELPEEVRRCLAAEFTRRDQLFSLYRPDSEASRLNRGELALAHTCPEFQVAHCQAVQWANATDGCFDIQQPGGGTDLSGIVKALAIEAAGRVLVAAEVPAWCINAGGDVLVAGLDPVRGQPWTIGIVDPDNRAQLVSQARLAAPRRAIATSGIAERGEHIWAADSAAPGGKGACREIPFQQVSVVANDIVTADVLATAIAAGGQPMLDLATAQWDIDVLAFGRDGSVLATEAFLQH